LRSGGYKLALEALKTSFVVGPPDIFNAALAVVAWVLAQNSEEGMCCNYNSNCLPRILGKKCFEGIKGYSENIGTGAESINLKISCCATTLATEETVDEYVKEVAVKAKDVTINNGS
jgi:hypothetical protein